MTDREKLIELLVEARSKAFTLCNDHAVCKGCEYEKISGCHRACIADRLIANGVTLQRWIPVTERLPEAFVSVLVQMPGEKPFPTVREGFISNNGVWHSAHFDRESDEVTHWMPMPEPPEE